MKPRINPLAAASGNGNGNSRLVYSTETGTACPGCGRPKAQCVCKTRTPVLPADGFVRVSRETKGRKGKGVTLVNGLPLDDAALGVMSRQLKASCGSGGTVKDGVIEVQGDHVEKVMAVLVTQGYKVKRAGG